MNVEFANASGYIYLLIAVAVAALVFFSSKISKIELAMRSFLLLVLAIALLEPYLLVSEKVTSATLLLDISDSMDEAVGDKLLDTVKVYEAAGVSIQVAPFASQVADKTEDLGDFSKHRESWESLDIGSTNLEAALAVHGTSSANVLLLSDGNETSGSAQELVRQRANSSAKIFPIIPKVEVAIEGAFRISSLEAPLIAPAKKSVEIRTSLMNSTTEKQSGLLTVVHDEKEVYRERVSVEPGRELVVVSNSDPSSEGIKKVQAHIKPDREGYLDSSETVFISGETREKVLLISGEKSDARYLNKALAEQSYQLEQLVTPGKNSTLPDLNKFSVLMLNNIKLDQLPSGSADTIEKFVRSGGGMIMLGSNRSFGLGGYRHTAIEDILPVELVPPQTKKKRLNVAVQLVIDKSRSMVRNQKIDYAKEAAREVIQQLKDDDYVGVTGFDDSAFPVVKLQQLGRSRSEALNRIRFLVAAGNTNLLPALRLAQRTLEGARAGRKHVIILTDGELPDSRLGGKYYRTLVQEMSQVGITLSAVMLGNARDDLLREIAEMSGGAYYQSARADQLPRLFLQDIKVNTGERTIKEQEFTVRRGPDGVVSTDLESFPPVLGYVQTKKRDKARLELVAYGNDKAEPLLASMQVEKGRTIAFTSDANGRWSSFWVRWKRYQQFWSDVIDSARGGSIESGEKIKFNLGTYVERGTLTLDLSVFSDSATGAVSGELKFPGGETRSVQLNRVARGRHKVEVDGITAGTYQFAGRVGDSALSEVAFNLSGELFGERKGARANTELLESLATLSGGSVNPELSELQGNLKEHKRDLTPIVLLLALILFCLEIFRREVLQTRWFQKSLRKKAAV